MFKNTRLAAAATLAVMATALAVAGAVRAVDSSVPPSVRNVVTNTYHGVQVSDPYRWLEDSADPKVHDWNGALMTSAPGGEQRTPEVTSTL